jgi:hypothetical protein
MSPFGSRTHKARGRRRSKERPSACCDGLPSASEEIMRLQETGLQSRKSSLVDKGGIPARLIYSSLFSPKPCSSLWVKVGEHASPKTNQKCKLDSRIIRRRSFAVLPQEEGYPLSVPHSSVITSLTPLSVRMRISSIDSRGLFASYTGFLPSWTIEGYALYGCIS